MNQPKMASSIQGQSKICACHEMGKISISQSVTSACAYGEAAEKDERLDGNPPPALTLLSPWSSSVDPKKCPPTGRMKSILRIV